MRCWRRGLLWTARRSSQLTLKEISPEYSLEGLMLKLKLHNFGHLRQWADSLEKTLMLERLRAEGEGDNRRWDGWMISLSQWTWVWVNSGSWWWTGRPGLLWFMGSQRVGHDWVTELNWILSHWNISFYPFRPKLIFIARIQKKTEMKTKTKKETHHYDNKTLTRSVFENALTWPSTIN